MPLTDMLHVAINKECYGVFKCPSHIERLDSQGSKYLDMFDKEAWNLKVSHLL